MKKKHSAAMMFLGHSDEARVAQESGRDEDVDAKSPTAEQKPNVDTIEKEPKEKGRSIKIEHQVHKFEGIQSHVGPITTKFPVGGLGTSTTVLEESPRIFVGAEVTKPEDQCFKKLPEIVLTRYPKMAKYLNTLPAPMRAISIPSLPREKQTACPTTPPREHAEEGAGTTGSGGPGDATPRNEVVESEDGIETPIFKLVPRKSRRKAVRIQGNTVESKMLPIFHHIPDTGPVGPVSLRPSLPERYAIPVTVQRNEFVAQKSTGIPVHGVREAAKTEEELLMEQLTLIDERFSRESVGKLSD